MTRPPIPHSSPANAELLPCPFCGEQPQATANGWGATIHCDNKNCIDVATSDSSLKDAAKSWNARAPENGLEWMARSAAPFHAALKKYPDAFEALHFLFNEMNLRIRAQCVPTQAVENAIREYFKSTGSSAVVSSDGIERVYYSGFSLIKLAETITSALTSPERCALNASALLDQLLSCIDFDGMDPNTFTIAELRRAI